MPRGDDSISAGALGYGRGSSGVARRAAVSVMRSAGAVGGSLVRAGRAIGAAPAGDGSSADAASEVLDPSSCSLSRGDDAIGAGALGYSPGSSGGARGAAVGVMRSAGAVGRSMVRAGRAISAAPAGDGSSVVAVSEVLDASSCSFSRGDDAFGAGALDCSLGSSGGARGAADGVMRLADAVCGLFVRAGRAVSAAPAADGSGVDAACEVLDASSCSLSRGDNTIGAGDGSSVGAASEMLDASSRSLLRGNGTIGAGNGSSVDAASEVLGASSCSSSRGDGAIGAGALGYSLGSNDDSTGASVLDYSLGSSGVTRVTSVTTSGFAAFRSACSAWVVMALRLSAFSHHSGGGERGFACTRHATERSGRLRRGHRPRQARAVAGSAGATVAAASRSRLMVASSGRFGPSDCAGLGGGACFRGRCRFVPAGSKRVGAASSLER